MKNNKIKEIFNLKLRKNVKTNWKGGQILILSVQIGLRKGLYKVTND